MKYRTLTMIIESPLGMNIRSQCHVAALCSVENESDVEFNFNGKKYRVEFQDILAQVKIVD